MVKHRLRRLEQAAKAVSLERRGCPACRGRTFFETDAHDPANADPIFTPQGRCRHCGCGARMIVRGAPLRWAR